MASDAIYETFGHGEIRIYTDAAPPTWEGDIRVSMAAGTLAVLMDRPIERRGGVLAAGTGGIEHRLTPATGIVMAAGPGVAVTPGDRVVVDPLRSKLIEQPQFGNWGSDDSLRVFGRSVTTGGLVLENPIDYSVLGIMSEQIIVDAGGYVATGPWVWIARDEVIDETSGILLPESAQWGNSTGTVLSVGGDALRQFPALEPGSRVLYMARARTLSGIGHISFERPVTVQGSAVRTQRISCMHHKALLAILDDDVVPARIKRDDGIQALEIPSVHA